MENKTDSLPALKKGVLVTVFQKHITGEDKEGIARLVSPAMEGGDEEGGYYWNVRFVGSRGKLEAETFARWVHARHITSALKPALPAA